MGLFNFKKKEDDKKSKVEKFLSSMDHAYKSVQQMPQEELDGYRKGYNLIYAKDHEVKAVLLLDYFTVCMPRLDLANADDDDELVSSVFDLWNIPKERVKELRRHMKLHPLPNEIRDKWY